MLACACRTVAAPSRHAEEFRCTAESRTSRRKSHQLSPDHQPPPPFG